MKLNKSLITTVLVTMLSSFSLLACSEKTEVREEKVVQPVVVPDANKDVNVTVHTDNTAPVAPPVENKTTTTVQQNTDTGTVQTKSETTSGR